MPMKVVINHAGIRALLRSPAVAQDLLRRAQRIAAAAGPGYEASVNVGPNRARASVITASPAAIRDNAKNQTLLRSLDAGR